MKQEIIIFKKILSSKHQAIFLLKDMKLLILLIFSSNEKFTLDIFTFGWFHSDNQSGSELKLLYSYRCPTFLIELQLHKRQFVNSTK